MPRKPRTIEEFSRAGGAFYFFRSEYRKRKAWLDYNGHFGEVYDSYEYIKLALCKADHRVPADNMAKDLYLDRAIGKIIDWVVYSETGFRCTAYKGLEEYAERAIQNMLNIDRNFSKHIKRLIEFSFEYGAFAPDIMQIYKFDALVVRLIKEGGKTPLTPCSYDFHRRSREHEKGACVEWLTEEMLLKMVRINETSRDFFRDKITLVVDCMNERFDLEEAVKIIKIHIVEKRAHLLRLREILSGERLGEREYDREKVNSFEEVIKKLPNSIDYEKPAERLIGLVMWDRIHIENMGIDEAFVDLISKNIPWGHSASCDGNGKCSICPDGSVGNSNCHKRIIDYYRGTMDSIQSGEVLSLTPKHNRKKREPH